VYHCPPLTQPGKEWVETMHHGEDTLNFVSNSGKLFTFIAFNIASSPSYIQDPCTDRNNQCECDGCVGWGGLKYKSDSTVNMKQILEYNISERYSENPVEISRFYTINIFDFLGFYSDNSNYGTKSESFSSINVNGVVYQNITVYYNDTTDYINQRIWKIYFSQQEGLIAFMDRNSQELFVKQ